MRGKWIERLRVLLSLIMYVSSLVRGKWIESDHRVKEVYHIEVFPREREVD